MNTECSFVIEQGPRDVTEVATEQTKYNRLRTSLILVAVSSVCTAVISSASNGMIRNGWVG